MPDLGQVSENSSQPSTKQRCHVLHDRVAWSYHANGSKQFPPESRTLAGNSGALSSVADVLAGKASADDVGLAVSKFSAGDVVVAEDAWKVFGENLSTERVDLTERDGSHSGSFEPEAEAANPAKEVEDTHCS